MIFPVLEPQDRAYLLSDENKRDSLHVIDDLHFPQFCAGQLQAKAFPRKNCRKRQACSVRLNSTFLRAGR